IVVGKEEAAKIGNKRLDTGAHRDEIEVFIHIRQFHFREGFFQRDLCVCAIGSPANIDIDHAILARVKVVRNTESRRNLDGPVSWLENSIAMKKLKGELNSFADRQLLRLPEEFATAGLLAADV